MMIVSFLTNVVTDVGTTILNSSWMFYLLVVSTIVSFGLNIYISSPLLQLLNDNDSNKTINKAVPDTRVMGYTVSELNDWYDVIGVDGCTIYIQACYVDFFAIMITYPLLLSTILVSQLQTLQQPQQRSNNQQQNVCESSSCWINHIVLLPFVTVMCDVVETFIQQKGCIIMLRTNNNPPEQLLDLWIVIASRACQLKWILLSLAISIIVGTWIYNRSTTIATTPASSLSNSNKEPQDTTTKLKLQSKNK